MIEIVSATRLAKAEFWKSSPLGQSLRRLAQDARLSSFIAFENRRGLPEVYNARIDSPAAADILAFIHDDVWIDDFFLADRLLAALDAFTWDDKANLSGRMAFGNYPFGTVWIYGDTPAPCELLDGVLLAARKDTLRQRGLRFDPAFDFHFYDLDFCRSARTAGASLGTWPICLTHQSGGNFDGPDWKRLLDTYRAKWPD
jgi:GT2 family glycosyltransferase